MKSQVWDTRSWWLYQPLWDYCPLLYFWFLAENSTKRLMSVGGCGDFLRFRLSMLQHWKCFYTHSHLVLVTNCGSVVSFDKWRIRLRESLWVTQLLTVSTRLESRLLTRVQYVLAPVCLRSTRRVPTLRHHCHLPGHPLCLPLSILKPFPPSIYVLYLYSNVINHVVVQVRNLNVILHSSFSHSFNHKSHLIYLLDISGTSYPVLSKIQFFIFVH